MPNLRPFQIVLLGGFLFLAFVSIILLQSFSPTSRDENNPYGSRVVVWGPFPFNEVNEVLELIRDEDDLFESVVYVSIPPEQFATRFVNAIAEGNSPDLVMLPHTELVNQRSKLLPIPYDTDGFSVRDLRDTFIDGADIFALNDGVYGVPYLVDPLVMYWNRDLFAGAGFTGAPQTWEALVGSVAPALTIRDNSRNILQSAVAFGEYRNVRNATPVLSLLMMQSGSQLVTETNRGYEVALNEAMSDGRPPLEAALQFFTDFANASNPLYSWNRAQEEDRLAFIAADLAMYFGGASEAEEIQSRNPNLNFDVSLPPQGANATIRRTYGTFYSLAIPRASRNAQGAFNAALVLANPQNSLNLAAAVNHVPASRAALLADITDPYAEVAYQAALFARGWLSPSPSATEAVFQAMVEDVNSSRSRVSSAVSDTINRLILAY
tara:strand:- start:2528 stop:3838 length:1311 start_codon:yes stop_codon:yes gene_type:complete